MQKVCRFIEAWLSKRWYSSQPIWYLQPFTLLYQGIVQLRRYYYRKKNPIAHFQGPVIIVGNLTVGGTGKTPLVIYLANLLIQQGKKPGIVTRGYKGLLEGPTQVQNHHTVLEAGDEALLLYQEAQCPIIVSKKRVEALPLLSRLGCDIILSDDGLQHYALVRNMEILVVDGKRRFGNGYCLPSGPLREPITRINDVDFVVVNEGEAGSNEYRMGLAPTVIYNLINSKETKEFSDFKGKRVHALAGIGNPERFFDMLKKEGIEVVAHAYPDHYDYQENDLVFEEALPILMTEKDAVKCKKFAKENYWSVKVKAVLPEVFNTAFLNQLKVCSNGYKTV